ncbi:acetyl-CoA carboxylase biotin carboxyl carrier protein [soil metagenome]
MDLKLVKNLLDLISESEVNEVSIEEGDFKIKVKKTADTHASQLQYQIPAQQQSSGQPQTGQPAAAQQTPVSEEKASSEDKEPDGEVVKSPIVGTFFEAASPDSEPFVKVGDKVNMGDTLCIIEAMKIMNEIDAEFSGSIQKIIVKDGQPVEFDQPLFIIKKA